MLLTAVADSPCARRANNVILLDFADEESVVQTRFATTALVLLRASLGDDVEGAARAAEAALAAPLPLEPGTVDQITFLGSGWTVGLASEAALKLRESAQAWAESYPAMEYRHGPIAIAQPGRAVWPFGPLPPGLADQILATGRRSPTRPTSSRWPRSCSPSASPQPKPPSAASTRTAPAT